ncbi:MAG: hypothetical protein ABII12_01145 [Planctomycetota bacterium]
MSANDDIENLLAETPTRTMPDDDRRRISDAIRAADGGRQRRRWWSRTIPAWQAAAACLAVCLITWSAARLRDGLSDHRPPPMPNAADKNEQAKDLTAFVSIDRPLFGRRHRSAYRTSIANWQPINTN